MHKQTEQGLKALNHFVEKEVHKFDFQINSHNDEVISC